MAKMSRANRFGVAVDRIFESIAEVEDLRDELQEWLDNIPENLQGGTKAEELEEAIGDLEEVLSALDEAVNIGVDFPGMF